jgi:hypothetical protein
MTALAKPFALVRWLVKLELGIWHSLFLWIARRVPGEGPGVETFGYAKQVTPIIVVIAFVSALEVIVVDLLLPWQTARLVLLVLGLWGLLWMVGFLAAMRVFRHLVADDGLRIRSGTSVDIFIAWERVQSISARRDSIDTRSFVHVDGNGIAHVPVMKQTRVAVVLREPAAVALPNGRREIEEVRLYVDDPAAFVAAARARLRRVEPAVQIR